MHTGQVEIIDADVVVQHTADCLTASVTNAIARQVLPQHIENPPSYFAPNKTVFHSHRVGSQA